MSPIAFRFDTFEHHGPAAEARSIFVMVMKGHETIKGARELIGVPPEVRQRLGEFQKTGPESFWLVEEALGFRARVSVVFEKLLADRWAGTIQ